MWPNYVPTAYLSDSINKARWRLRNTRMIETFDGLGMPHSPLFLRHTLEGFGDFYATGAGEEVPDAFQQEMIDDTGENGYAWWHGGESPTYGYPMAGYTFPAESFSEFNPAWALGSNVLMEWVE
jgi:hypothetical protein